MSKILKILTVLVLFLEINAHSATISSVDFEGLTHTKKEFLNQLIKCKVGLVYDSAVVKEDEQTLKNLNLFFAVSSQIHFNPNKDSVDLTFIIQEAKYIYPLVSISGFKDVLKIQAGLNHINWRGRNQTIGFLYQYYDRHSLSLYQKTPRHKNGKTGHEVSLAKYSTIEPLYFKDTTSNFNFDNYSISAFGKYWVNTKLNFNLGGMLMYENYLQLDNAEVNLPGKEFNFFKYQLKASIDFNSINRHYEYLDGLKLNLYAETIQTKDYPTASFFKLKSTINLYKRLGYRSNVALNHTFGIATNNPSPFSPFVLDGFLNIRGIGNRVSRGTAENIINLEYRFSVLNKKYLTIQTVAFTDIGSLRQPGEQLGSLFSSNSMNYYAGIGLRLHSKFFYKTIFRLDYASNLQDLNQGGFTFGFGQFF